MLKALLKKQFMEFFAGIFINRKTGKARSKNGVVGFIILFAFLFAYIASMFFGIGMTLSSLFSEPGYEWLYFSIFSIIACGFGIIGSAFTTYSAIYKAKDNDFLLSMPIKPGIILFVRMFSILVMSALYSGIVWVPGVIVYIISGFASAIGIIYSILMWLVLSLFITVIAALLGFLIALIAGRVKRKSLVTVICTIVFLGLYYLVCFKLSDAITAFIQNPEVVGDTILKWLYPMYAIGTASLGNTLSFVIILGAVAVLFGLLYFILSKSFIKIVTTNKGSKKVEYKGNNEKGMSVKRALLRRESRRFFGSSVYLINCGLGVLFLIGISIFLIIKTSIKGFELAYYIGGIAYTFPYITAFVPAFIFGITSLIVSMDCYTAPSISLEGENLWIVRSMPVKSIDILIAKEKMHIIINALPACILAVTLGIVTLQSVVDIILITACCFVYTVFAASFGLKIGIKRANLHWTNESIPVKQDTAIMLTLFGTWGITMLATGVCVALSLIIPTWAYLTILCLAFVGLCLLENKWVKTKGVCIFEEL